MLDKYLSRLRLSLWKKRLPLLSARDTEAESPYDYYSVYLMDVARDRYRLITGNDHGVTIEKWDPRLRDYREKSTLTLSQLDQMQAQIIHYRRYGPVKFDNIIGFTFNYYTRFIYIKTLFGRGKGKLISAFFAGKEIKSRDRIALLNLMVNEHIQQNPAKVNTGISVDEVVALLYGRLWYQHIRNEEFQRKVTLLMNSLVITEDLALRDDRYYVQGKAVATIVEYEKEDRRNQQQVKIQKNILRLMLVITASTLLITLALLALAGVVDLHKIWQYIINLKPLRVLLKLI